MLLRMEEEERINDQSDDVFLWRYLGTPNAKVVKREMYYRMMRRRGPIRNIENQDNQ